MQDKYLFSFDEFLKENPDIKPEWKPFIEPVIRTQEESMFAFIMTYIFM